MLIIQEALVLTDTRAITREIVERRGLIDQMVGWLYVEITEREITQLLKRIDEIQREGP